MEVAIPLVSFLLLGEPFFDLKLGRGMAISLSLKNNIIIEKWSWPSHYSFLKANKNGGGHSSLLKLGRGWPSPNPLIENKNNGVGHIPIPVRKSSRNGGDHPFEDLGLLCISLGTPNSILLLVFCLGDLKLHFLNVCLLGGSRLQLSYCFPFGIVKAKFSY